MRQARLLLIAATGLIVSSALAQSKRDTDIGSLVRIPKRAESPNRLLSKEELSRELMNQFARCTIDRRPGRVVEAISLPAGADDQAFNGAVTDECLSEGRMQFSPSVVRGAVFGELYRRQQKGMKNVTKAFPVRPLDWSAQPQPTDSDRARTNFFLLSMTDCIYKSKAEAVRSVVVNPVGSSAQKAGYVSLIPAIGPCVPQGQKLAFSRAMLEAAFGEYLYRSIVPAIPPVPAKAR